MCKRLVERFCFVHGGTLCLASFSFLIRLESENLNFMKIRATTSVGLKVAAAGVFSLIVLVAMEELGGWNAVYAWQQRRMVKRVLAGDPSQLLSAGRQMLQHRADFVGEIDASAPEIPSAIRELKPTRISISTTRVVVEFSDVFNPFGIFIYASGSEGRGSRKWIDGLWL